MLPRRTFLFLFLAYSCQSHEFRCRNSLCVDRNHLCDGVRHCTDGTDELAENCDKNNIISGKQHLHTFFNIFFFICNSDALVRFHLTRIAYIICNEVFFCTSRLYVDFLSVTMRALTNQDCMFHANIAFCFHLQKLSMTIFCLFVLVSRIP